MLDSYVMLAFMVAWGGNASDKVLSRIFPDDDLSEVLRRLQAQGFVARRPASWSITKKGGNALKNKSP